MATKEVKIEASKGVSKKNESVTIDVGQLYKFTPDMLEQNIVHSTYSNLAYIQVSHRDVSIDFYQMPGIRNGNKQEVPGTRIFMSHVAAQKMALSLLNILNNIHNHGDMEKFEPKEVKSVKPTTIIKSTKKGKTI